MTKKTRRKIKPRPLKPHPFKIEAVVEEKVEDEVSEPEISPITLPWLTVETLLYGLIFVSALALRLWRLGAYPLSDIEAHQSLLALALYRGDLPAAGYYSPLLVSLNALTFLLFGGSDVSARLASVLLGSALVILPLTLRRQLGPRVCLLASALMAISPTAIYLSRTLNSEVGVAAGALMIVSGLFNWVEDKQQRWLLLLAGGLAFLLAAGSMAYSILIVFGLIVLLQISTFRGLWANQPAESEDSSRGDLRNAGIFSLVTLVLLSTAALFNLTGLGELTSSLPDWLSRFSFEPRLDAGFNAIFSLTIYDPLLVFSGLTGLAFVIVRRNLLTTIFGIWFVGLLLLDVLMAGRPNSNVILPLVPLVFLAASALGELWEGLKKFGTWQNEGLLLAVGLAISSFSYIYLTAWLTRACGSDDLACQYTWLISITGLALFLIIVIFFWLMSDANVAIRGAALVAVAVGLLVTISLGWRLNYGPLMHLAYQPLAGAPASTELVALAETLTGESLRQAGDEVLLDVTLAGVASPALRWQLRNYRHLQETRSGIESPTTAIITPASSELGLGQAYLGQDFALNVDWSPVGLRSKDLIKWLIYRRGDKLPNSEVGELSNSKKVVLWLRLEEQ